jgi:hypothetical protein
MRKTVLLLMVLFLFVQCDSVQKYNSHYDALISIEKLKADVDFTYKKLQQLHPNLYGYIDKGALDYKFDSLKKTINKPLKPLDFYKKINPVVAAVRQGHLYVYTPLKRLTKKESKALTKKGTGPFSQFDFEYFDNKLYILDNKSQDSTIIKGSEVISVNGIKPADLLNEYSAYYSSDGFNTTYKPRGNKDRFSTFFVYENGIKDSLVYALKYRDTIKYSSIKRFKKDKEDNKKSDTLLQKKQPIDREKIKETKRKKRINGYNPDANNYNRNLQFLEKDSSIAVIKIRGFSNRSYKKFYKEAFEKIKKYDSSSLILDLRDNGGGRLSEINYLYGFLADTSFVFLKPSEVVSKSSVVKGMYLNQGKVVTTIAKTILYPFTYIYSLLTTHKSKEGVYYENLYTKVQQPKDYAFKGKIYVLINGKSFSASSILSANLQGSKRATFIGEETGGAYNSTVAGLMPRIELPNSHITIKIGLINISPYFQTKILGHGIYPDHEILPTLQDRLTKTDRELNWILNEIKSTKKP